MRKRYVYVGVVFLVFWTLAPVYFMLMMSITPEIEINTRGFSLLPLDPTFRNYLWVLQQYKPGDLTGNFGTYSKGFLAQIPFAFFNSVVLSLAASVVATSIAVFGAYAFGRMRFRFKNSIFFVFLSSQMLPSIAIVIPYFTLLTNSGLVGTYQGLILTYLTLIIPLATWVLSGYFATLPLEVEKAARIDGASRLKAITKVILPMARPGIVAIWLLSLLLAWNEMLFGLLIGGDQVKPIQPLILQLSPLCGTCYSEYSVIGALMITAIVIPLIISLFFQRYITKLNIVDPVTLIQ